jgi:hypothetical protein
MATDGRTMVGVGVHSGAERQTAAAVLRCGGRVHPLCQMHDACSLPLLFYASTLAGEGKPSWRTWLGIMLKRSVLRWVASSVVEALCAPLET